MNPEKSGRNLSLFFNIPQHIINPQQITADKAAWQSFAANGSIKFFCDRGIIVILYSIHLLINKNSSDAFLKSKSFTTRLHHPFAIFTLTVVSKYQMHHYPLMTGIFF